jgi:hypothetical protein
MSFLDYLMLDSSHPLTLFYRLQRIALTVAASEVTI